MKSETAASVVRWGGMTVSIESRFVLLPEGPVDMLLQFEAAAIPEQTLISAETWLSDETPWTRVSAQDDIGERLWTHSEKPLEARYRAEVRVQRILPDLETLQALPQRALPGEAVQYLLDSRFCPARPFHPFADAEFGGTSGGARIIAIRDWLARYFTYAPGSSHDQTSALDSFVERRGVCRDYAHVLISLARASEIPARFVACYAPDVDPPDFHAVAEVFLADPSIPGGGAWHIVDGTGMADAAQTVKIGVGRDATDVSFATTFGPCGLSDKDVTVRELQST